MPHNFGKHLTCWKNSGRKGCEKDKAFKTMESDMHNLVPRLEKLTVIGLTLDMEPMKPKRVNMATVRLMLILKLREPM